MTKTKKIDGWQVTSNVVLGVFSLLAVIPFVLLVIASFTDNQWVMINGITFFPEEWEHYSI